MSSFTLLAVFVLVQIDCVKRKLIKNALEWGWQYWKLSFEPPHDKTNNMTVRPVKTPISQGICPVWSESSLCTQWVAKDPSFLHADSEDWSDAGDGKDSDQTGQMPRRLIWVFAGRTGHFVGFVVRRLIWTGISSFLWHFTAPWRIAMKPTIYLPKDNFEYSYPPKWATSWENLSSGFETSEDSNRPAQLMRLARVLKFRL